jgi:hypothetical protein
LSVKCRPCADPLEGHKSMVFLRTIEGRRAMRTAHTGLVSVVVYPLHPLTEHCWCRLIPSPVDWSGIAAGQGASAQETLAA